MITQETKLQSLNHQINEIHKSKSINLKRLKLRWADVYLPEYFTKHKPIIGFEKLVECDISGAKFHYDKTPNAKQIFIDKLREKSPKVNIIGE